MLKASATRGAWPPLASARWGVRRRRDRSIVVASWATGVEVTWGSRGWHATASRVWWTPSETRVTWRRGWRGSMPGHGGEGPSEVHVRRWGRRGRAHAHWSTPTSVTSKVWVRSHPSHSSHWPKAIHGWVLHSTPPTSWWTKAFHHAPSTTHTASVHTAPSTTASETSTTPGFEFSYRFLRFILGGFRSFCDVLFSVCIHFNWWCSRGRFKK